MIVITDWSPLEEWIEEQEGFSIQGGATRPNWGFIKDEEDAKEKLKYLLQKEVDRVGPDAAGGLARYIKSNDWKDGYTADGFRMRGGKRISISTRPRPESRQLGEVLKAIKTEEEKSIKYWEERIKKETNPEGLDKLIPRIREIEFRRIESSEYLKELISKRLEEVWKERIEKETRPEALGRAISVIQETSFRNEESRRRLQELINKRLEVLNYSAAAEVDLIEKEVDTRVGQQQLRGLKNIIRTRSIPDIEKERLTKAVDEKINEGRRQYAVLDGLLRTSTDPTLINRVKETARVSTVLGPRDRQSLMERSDIRLDMIRTG